MEAGATKPWKYQDLLWDSFAKHIEYDLAAGGPDPHMRTVGRLIRDVSMEEKIWRIGCYVAVYNVPSAEVIWQHWPWERVVNDLRNDFGAWITENWKGLNFRRERRAVRTPKKLSRYFVSYIEFARGLQITAQELPSNPHDAYRALWKEVDRGVYGAGRYACSKLMECYQRYCGFKIDMPDILPRGSGSWSPRLTLADLFPEQAEAINPRVDNASSYEASLRAAEKAMVRLKEEYDLPIDTFRFEVFLCDFRQSYAGGKQFPGRSNDSEIMHHDKIKSYWGDAYQTEMYTARAAIMPPECRGEVSGWNNVREELGSALRDHGYVWSDILYDYHAIKDIAHPVYRGGATLETLRNYSRYALSTR